MQRVTPEQGFRLAKIGYDQPCMIFIGETLYAGYESMRGKKGIYPAPLITEALEWCRQERGLVGEITAVYRPNELYEYYAGVAGANGYIEGEFAFSDYFPTRDKAESALLNEFLTTLESRACGK